MKRILPIVAAGIAAALILLVAPSFAQAVVEAPGEVALRPLFDELMPLVVELAMVGLFGLATWVAVMLKAKFGIDMEKAVKDIEARHRETLHSAIYSAVAALRQKTGVDNIKFNVGSEDVAYVLRYLRDSAPDALAYFSPSNEVIAKIAAAKAVEVAAKAAPPASS